MILAAAAAMAEAAAAACLLVPLSSEAKTSLLPPRPSMLRWQLALLECARGTIKITKASVRSGR